MARQPLTEIVANTMREAGQTSNLGLRAAVEGDISDATETDVRNLTLALLHALNEVVVRLAAEVDNLCARVDALEAGR